MLHRIFIPDPFVRSNSTSTSYLFFFFFNDTATTEIYTLSLHDALPIYRPFEMASGAGHDAAVFTKVGIPSAMIFVRNENGSHNPDEAMSLEDFAVGTRSEEHTSELQSQSISYAVFCLKKKKQQPHYTAQ